MITENTIDGLIPCQERMINGESLLYYDITSRQSIQSILEAQPLQMRHLQKLFSGLRTISEVMEKYLLSPEDLLLLPEFVYMDMATGEYSFIYYPERMGEENTSLRDLNEFFMQHMDSEATGTPICRRRIHTGIREFRVGKFRYKMQAGIGAHREQHRRCPGMKGRRTEGRSGEEM